MSRSADPIFVGVELRTFRFRSGSNSRLFGPAHLKFLSAAREHSEKRQLRLRLFVPEITNGEDKIRKTE